MSFDRADLLILLLLVVACCVLTVRDGGTSRADQRQVDRWASRHLVVLDEETRAALQRAMSRRRRTTRAVALLVGCLFFAVMTFSSPSGRPPEVPVLISLAVSAMYLVAYLWQLNRDWEVSGSGARSAHLRVVSIDDYVARSLRGFGWLAGLASASYALSVAATRPLAGGSLVVHLLLGGGVLVSLGLAEWSGRRYAAAPQRARTDVGLYAQDAWRADSTASAFASIAMVGVLALLFLNQDTGVSQTFRHWTESGTGLLAVLFLVITIVGEPPTQRIRRRLWPHLGAGGSIGAHTEAVAS